MYKVRFHSRGGQGGVTAARLLATAALRDGNCATACPFCWAELRGAPVVSFVRIDNRPIRAYSPVREPNLVVVLDASVTETVDVVVHSPKTGGRVVVNSARKKRFDGFGTSHVDLPGIALGENLVVSGGPIPNTPVPGTLARIGIVSADSAGSAIRGLFADELDVGVAEIAYAETSP